VSGNSKWEMSGKLTAMEHRSQLPKQMEGVSLMRRLTPLLIQSLVASLIVSMVGHVQASIVLEPADLNPGDQYRLVFVTSANLDATSSAIGDYNDFVDDYGDLAIASDWKAIASTASADARDNTETNPSGSSGVPIYNLAGLRVADDFDDLWDASIQNSIARDENGGYVNRYVWTGTQSDGTAAASPLGTAQPRLGSSAFTDGDRWINSSTYQNYFGDIRLYGMSDTLMIPFSEPVPEPASVITWTLLGIVGCVGTWWNRRRKAA
ncbi:MAG: hypothetical protein ABGZ17_06510, partial [Planctomycetaceae bacterium]